MSYFVSVTFDLNEAPGPAYTQVRDELDQLDLSPWARGKKTEVRLPRNVFVAEFEDGDFERSRGASDWVAGEIDRIFKKVGVSGRYFVAVGKGWAWKVGHAG